jgi:hypothetical protein
MKGTKWAGTAIWLTTCCVAGNGPEIRKLSFKNMGTLSPYPWDLTHYGIHGLRIRPRTEHVSADGGNGQCPLPPWLQLSRRSGRIPALPYPPLSCNQYSGGR